MDTSLGYAQHLDAQDELQKYRQEFRIAPGMVYMCGNSLGLLSQRSEHALARIMDAFKAYGVEAWIDGEEPWFFLAEKLGGMAAPLVGAKPNEVIIAGSTSVNLHQLLATFFEPKGRRTKILIDEFSFPTDMYVAKSQLLLRGLDPAEHLVIAKSRDGNVLEEEDIMGLMNDEIALAVLPSVIYSTGQLLDIPLLTKAAHDRGILMCIDACHGAGAVPHEFHKDGVDIGVFCTYKYVNGGPGSPAALFVHEKHLGKRPALAGWFSSRKDVQFDMGHELVHAETAGAYQIGTPHIVSLAPLQGALELLNEAGIHRIRAKSLKLTDYLKQLIDAELRELGFAVATPEAAERRGGHIALAHDEAFRICKALKQRGVIPDFRHPNIVRLAPSPLYGTFEEIHKVVQMLKDIVQNKTYLEFSTTLDVVT